MALSEQQIRTITGLTLAAALGVFIFHGGVALRLLVLAVSVLALLEFYTMYWPGRQFPGRKIAGLLFGAGIVLSQALGPQWTVMAVILSLVAVSLAFLVTFGTGRPETRFEQFGPLVHGLVYIPLVLQLALYLNPSEQCLVMLAAVAADTGGYYGGRHFGKRKLWPSVSPKKTRAGFTGGILLTVAVCAAQGLLGSHLGWSLPAIPLWGWPCAGVVLCLAAQFGDFFESALKRSLEVKDSGTLLPGHGGLLDRIDSVLFVLPVYMAGRMLLAATA